MRKMMKRAHSTERQNEVSGLYYSEDGNGEKLDQELWTMDMYSCVGLVARTDQKVECDQEARHQPLEEGLAARTDQKVECDREALDHSRPSGPSLPQGPPLEADHSQASGPSLPQGPCSCTCPSSTVLDRAWQFLSRTGAP
ncbi:hypothetical protein GOP47_0023921 [Adiantum capillus-veneris]|uniref:Uncharacterized protein n=1 Tax=Adiantum capillus-veneris TaxID=13818 RepID=A0A9D4U4G1_ADICA|nr:hypothetical protein GOP47_0023921 [Adiantum capillus-veneris]